MKQSAFQTVAYSFLGVLAVLAIVIAVNLLSRDIRLRADLTENKIYTLTAGTRTLLDRIDTPVTIRFYVSEQDNTMPVFLRNYAARVNDLLREYREASRGMIEILRIDPQPDSEAEDSANLDGVFGQPVSIDRQVYLGLSVTSVDRKVAVPFLAPDREALLEYDLSRAIAQVITLEKPLLGVLCPLPVFGESPMMFNPMIQQQPRAPWLVIRELQRDYEVRQIPVDATRIDDDITLLLVLHPNGISPETEFAIDQFLMRGGSLLAAVDPLGLAARFTSGGSNPMMPAPNTVSDLPNLIPAWGLNFDSGSVVADPVFRTQLSRGGAPESIPTVLSITPDGIHADDPVTGQIDNLLFLFAGAFEGGPVEGLSMEVLVHSSPFAGLVPAMQAEMEGEGIASRITPADEPLPMVVRLAGTFRTAFPDGNPDSNGPADHLTSSSGNPVVVLFSDVDFFYDEFAADVRDILGQQLVLPLNGNLDLFFNAVEQLAGDASLMQVRGRGAVQRPFTRIRQMEADAEDRFRETIQALEDELNETQQRIGQLQVDSDAGQQFILSPEQQAEIELFQRRRAEVRNELTGVRRSLRREINALENRLKWTNIVAVPSLVVLSGLGAALIRRRRTAAQ